MIIVDEPVWVRNGRYFAHLSSDTSFEELHQFAAGIGLKRYRFHRDHYDLPAELYGTVLERGAVMLDSRQLLSRLRAAGLRRKPARVKRRLAS